MTYLIALAELDSDGADLIEAYRHHAEALEALQGAYREHVDRCRAACAERHPEVDADRTLVVAATEGIGRLGELYDQMNRAMAAAADL